MGSVEAKIVWKLHPVQVNTCMMYILTVRPHAHTHIHPLHTLRAALDRSTLLLWSFPTFV